MTEIQNSKQKYDIEYTNYFVLVIEYWFIGIYLFFEYCFLLFSAPEKFGNMILILRY